MDKKLMIDIFCNDIVRMPSINDFNNYAKTAIYLIKNDLKLYLKIMKYKRHNKGLKLNYIIMLLILNEMLLKSSNDDITICDVLKKILDWSHYCKKDIMKISKILNNNYYPIFSLELYSDYLANFFIKISNNNVTRDDYLLIKYINTNHFITESKQIWKLLNEKNLIMQFDKPDADSKFMANIFNNNMTFTNKNTRKIKTYFMKYLNTFDETMKGNVYDGNILRKMSLDNLEKDSEIVCNKIKNSSYVCKKNIIKTISSMNNYTNKTPREIILTTGLSKYNKELKHETNLEILGKTDKGIFQNTDILLLYDIYIGNIEYNIIYDKIFNELCYPYRSNDLKINVLICTSELTNNQYKLLNYFILILWDVFKLDKIVIGDKILFFPNNINNLLHKIHYIYNIPYCYYDNNNIYNDYISDNVLIITNSKSNIYKITDKHRSSLIFNIDNNTTFDFSCENNIMYINGNNIIMLVKTLINNMTTDIMTIINNLLDDININNLMLTEIEGILCNTKDEYDFTELYNNINNNLQKRVRFTENI